MIRCAEPGDADALFVLAREFATSFVVDEASFRASLAAILASPDACLAVAERHGKIAGYVLAVCHPTFFANGRVAWVEEIMVEAAERRHCIGRSLLVGVEAWALTRGCALVALATRRAAGFYRAIGYDESATYFRKLL